MVKLFNLLTLSCFLLKENLPIRNPLNTKKKHPLKHAYISTTYNIYQKKLIPPKGFNIDADEIYRVKKQGGVNDKNNYNTRKHHFGNGLFTSTETST